MCTVQSKCHVHTCGTSWLKYYTTESREIHIFNAESDEQRQGAVSKVSIWKMENLAQSSPLVRKSKIVPAKGGLKRLPMNQLIGIMIDGTTLYICDTGIGAVKQGRG